MGWGVHDASYKKRKGGQERVVDIGGGEVDVDVARGAVWMGGGHEGDGIG